MKKIFLTLVALIAFSTVPVFAADCPANAIWCARRPADLNPLVSVDEDGNAVFNSSFTASKFFGDGSSLTGIGGSGDVVLASTQTHSGAKVYNSSITVGIKSNSVVADYSSVIRGGWSVVASVHPNAASSTDFTNINSSYTHRLMMNLTWGTSTGLPRMNFNSDTSALYANHSLGQRTDTTDASVRNNSLTRMQFSNETTAFVGIGFGVSSDLFITAIPEGREEVHWRGTSVHRRGAGGNDATRNNLFGTWRGATTLTSINLSVSAGDYTGEIYLMAFVPPVDP